MRRKNKNLIRVLAVALALLLAGGVVFSALFSALAEVSGRDRYEITAAYMPEEQALVILQSAVQNSFTEAVGTSFTQYSAIYNSARKTVRVWSFQDYGKSYSFDVTGKRID